MIRYLAIVWLFFPVAALPCTCADPGKDTSDKVIEAACSVDVVFVGQGTNKLPAPDHVRKIQIEPLIVFKGQVPVPAIIETSTTCDHWFSVHDEYLIFGNYGENPNRVVTSICGKMSVTHPFANVGRAFISVLSGE